MQARNPLWDAVEAVAKGTLDPNKPDANGNPLIFQVIATSNAKMLDALLETNKVDLKVKNSDGQSPVQYCQAKANEIGAQRRQDAKYIKDIENGIEIPQEEYKRLKEEMKKESGDNALPDAVFRSMSQAILVKAGTVAEARPARSSSSSEFVVRKDVSKDAQDLVTEMQIIKEWSSVAEKTYKSSLYETDPEKKKSLEASATKQVTKFCNDFDAYNEHRTEFNEKCKDPKNKNGKAELAYVISATKEYLSEAMPTKQLEQKLNINPEERRAKAKQDSSLLAEAKSKSDPGPQRGRSNSLGGDTRAPTRSRSATIGAPSAKEGNSTGSLLKSIFKGASPAVIRKDRAAASASSSAEASPSTEKSQSAAASPNVSRTPATSPASSEASSSSEKESYSSPGLGRRK